MNRSLRHPVRSTLALALLLASGAAQALGLGQIELLSKIGEPFVAQIPIVSSDPSELEQLRAGMPSRETFARIGLQEPDAVVSSLRFTQALDAAGRPVIRVTSDQPINEPLLNFLVEVEWGQGRLVREYSALIAAPRTVDAPLQPPIQAPQAAPSNAIVRAPVVAPDPLPPSPAPRPADAPQAQTPGSAPAPTPAAVAVAPAPAPAPASPAADRTVRVRAGQSLSEIASGVRGEVSLEQAMVSLLRANPDAFIDGDINQLRRGAVLRVPQPSDLAGVDAAEASALVRAQLQRWQDARRPVVAPDAVSAPASAPGDGVVAPVAPVAAAEAPTPTPSRPAQRGRARLEIVPPGASSARQAGTQSGLAAAGGGDMLRQEMQQAQETLVARDVELTEMKARVAELEALQKQQAQLITLKDSQLAAAQQRLAQTQQAAPATRDAPVWPWALGLLALLAVGALIAWLTRRQARDRAFRAPATAGAAPPSKASPLADAFAGGVAPPARAASGATPVPSPERAASDVAPASLPARARTAAETAPARAGEGRGRGGRAKARGRNVAAGTEAPRLPVDRATAPAVSAPPSRPAPPAVVAAPVATPAPSVASPAKAEAMSSPSASAPAVFAVAPTPATPAPTWHATTRAGVGAATPAPAAASGEGEGAANGHERLELARAYLDLGDQASARQLLVELVVNGDHASRQQASRLLRDLD